MTSDPLLDSSMYLLGTYWGGKYNRSLSLGAMKELSLG